MFEVIISRCIPIAGGHPDAIGAVVELVVIQDHLVALVDADTVCHGILYRIVPDLCIIGLVDQDAPDARVHDGEALDCDAAGVNADRVAGIVAVDDGASVRTGQAGECQRLRHDDGPDVRPPVDEDDVAGGSIVDGRLYARVWPRSRHVYRLGVSRGDRQ